MTDTEADPGPEDLGQRDWEGFARVDGDKQSLELLGQMIGGLPWIDLSTDEHGYAWLQAVAFKGLKPGQVYAAAERFLNVASGLMRLWSHTDGRLEVKTVAYFNPDTGKSGSIGFNLGRIVARYEPDELLFPVEGGTVGALLLQFGELHTGVGRALEILAGGAFEWWEIYLLLEILRDHYGAREGRKTGSWDATFKELRDRHQISLARLRDLKQTADYHRHAFKTAPDRPWEQAEAAQAVLKMLKTWIIEEFERPKNLSGQAGSGVEPGESSGP